MKLLIATGLYPPEIGGPATHTRVLEGLLPKEGVSVEVLPFSRVKRYPMGIRHLVYFFLLLRAALRADVLYALDPISVGIPAAIAHMTTRTPFVLRVAGDRAWEHATSNYGSSESLESFAKKSTGYPMRIRLMKRIQHFVALRARVVVVPSSYLKRVVHLWGVPEERIAVVYNGFDNMHGLGNRRTLRGLLQFRGKMLVSAGRLVPWKGFMALIEIMPELVKHYPDMRLFIVGEGPEYARLEERAKALGVERYVALGGALEQDVLLRYIQAADAFVLNTNYEGFSHQLLEVMSVGTPVITTNVGGNPELITHEKNGLLVRYNNKKQLKKAVMSVLDKPHLRRRLAESAERTASEFTYERMVRELLPILQSSQS